MSDTLSLKTLDERVSAIEALIPKPQVAKVAAEKTSFAERRAAAAKAKAKHDAAEASA